VLYLDDEEAEGEVSEREQEDPEELRHAGGMRGFLFRVCEGLGVKPIAFTASQIEIILGLAQTLNVFHHTNYFHRVVGHLRDQAQIDDVAVQRASEQAQQEFQQQG
jgi:hypothetical protein